MNTVPPSSRGVLYPARLPTFHRLPAEGDLAVFVRWFWIPEWDVEPGRVSRQHVVGYPACNLVVENGAAGIAGPTTRASFRDLSGTGWAVGALLLPAAVPALVDDVTALRDDFRPLDLPDLTDAVTAIMTGDAPRGDRHRAAISVFGAWLHDRLGEATDDGRLANRMVELAESDRTLSTITDLAGRLHVSTRTLQRLAATFVGLPPAALIRRRRLQEAAERLREDPGLDLTALALELGYADHAHLTNDFRLTLGFTPSGYRRSQSGGGGTGAKTRFP